MGKPIDDLIARVEAANGPDREIDADISRTLGLTYRDGAFGIGYGDDWPQAELTASIDAALALVERMLPGGFGTLAYFPESSEAVIMVDVSTETPVGNIMVATVFGRATARTLPLAILLALLRALASQGGKS